MQLLLSRIMWFNVVLISLYSKQCNTLLLPKVYRLTPSFVVTNNNKATQHTNMQIHLNDRILLVKQKHKDDDDQLSPSPVEIIESTKQNESQSLNMTNFQNLSRRDTFLLLVGGTAYAKLAYSVLMKLQRGAEVYPPEHEDRASDVFETAMSLTASYLLQRNKNKDAVNDNDFIETRPLRVLEVGIGSSCRTFMRGMYDDAIKKVINLAIDDDGIISGIEFTGVDIKIPQKQSIIDYAHDHINSVIGSRSSTFPITLDVKLADVSKGLPFPDGYFDVITTSLVLCSVQDQRQALEEIRRLLNPAGGSYGYIEHVAVNLKNEHEKNLGFLEWQQEVLDPFQQALAHNCHLHRDTDSAIYDILVGTSMNQYARVIQSERFQVKDMWPVSCQSRGVIQFDNRQ